MTNEMNDGLLPCPFCGGDAARGRSTDGPFINCMDCLAATNLLVPRGQSVDDAVAAWNTRAALSHPTPAFDAAAVREACAVALWKREAERAAPNVAKGRNAEAFHDQNEPDKAKWLDLADAAIRALADHEPTSKTVDDSGEAVGCQQEAVKALLMHHIMNEQPMEDTDHGNVNEYIQLYCEYRDNRADAQPSVGAKMTREVYLMMVEEYGLQDMRSHLISQPDTTRLIQLLGGGV